MQLMQWRTLQDPLQLNVYKSSTYILILPTSLPTSDTVAIVVIKQNTKSLQNKLEQLKNAVTEIK